MNLIELISDLPFIQLIANTENKPKIVNITSDSRQIKPGMLFVALVGSHSNGHDYIEKAIEAGAAAIIVESAYQTQALELAKANTQVTFLVADNTWKALGAIAHQFNNKPSEDMTLVGVTGTNGKTTVTHLVEQVLLDQKETVGLIGTLGIRGGKKETTEKDYQSTGHTTPMAVELHEILKQLRNEKNTAVVMEISSHALEQHRVYGCRFKVAVHTNLTQDHLDYHKTMTDYCKAKCLLFENLDPAINPVAVINADDEWADKFINATPEGITTLTYGLENGTASVKAIDVNYAIDGATFTVLFNGKKQKANLKIAGKFGVYNALAAIATGLGLGISLEKCITSLEKVSGVRGRFEVVAAEPSVIVDYAHTPDGLENVLAAAKLVTPVNARLITVFGCGGDRDATKRPKMGKIAEELADVLVITSDNPRTEDPQQILTDVLSGIERFDASHMFVNVDRKQAIHQAIDLAKPNDVIVVAGKGHEDYQILGTKTIHFDDREVVQDYIAQKANGTTQLI